jgi:hypothetical protein
VTGCSRNGSASTKKYEAEVEESFAGIHPKRPSSVEVVGEKMLLRMAKATYGDRDPAEFFAH